MNNTELEEYNKEIKEMEVFLSEIKEYLEKHPEKLGTQGNYETMKYLYEIMKNDKIQFINQINDIHLKINGKSSNSLTVNELNRITREFNETENSTMNIMQNSNYKEELLVNKVSQGSYKITFAFKNPTEEDVKRISPRKKGLIKIFDFINCGDDIERLKKEAGPKGHEALICYKKFINEIVKQKADFTLDTEKGALKASLTYEQCKNICENLNI